MHSFKLHDGISIPSIGLGTWQLTGTECTDTVTYAINNGYRHIDTASMYRNERAIGKAISQIDIDRDEIFITSKVWRSELGKEATAKSFHDSLSYLNTDYLDLYLIHWPSTNRQKRVESFGKMIELRDENKIRSIGVSNFSPTQIDEIHDTYGEYPVVNQIKLNPFNYNETNLNYCQSKDIVVTAYTPLNKGQGLNQEPITGLAKKYNKSVYQIVLRWFIDLGVVTIPKSATESHIDNNIDIFDFELTTDEVDLLKGI